MNVCTLTFNRIRNIVVHYLENAKAALQNELFMLRKFNMLSLDVSLDLFLYMPCMLLTQLTQTYHFLIWK